MQSQLRARSGTKHVSKYSVPFKHIPRTELSHPIIPCFVQKLGDGLVPQSINCFGCNNDGLVSGLELLQSQRLEVRQWFRYG